MSAPAERVCEQARALEPEARTAFVKDVCRGDPGLREEVLSLLEEAQSAEEFFNLLGHAVFSTLLPTDRDMAGDLATPFPNPELNVVDTIGHYRILSRIGSGGMGLVYRAHDTRLERDVALKFLPPQLNAQRDAENWLLAEAKAAAALEHPNVCTVHEIGETEDGRLFIAMTCYEGETLKERLVRGRLPVEEAVMIGAQIARGLAAAHGRGIVHQDVKPGNVMLAADGSVKLLDFGLAKAADATLKHRGSTPGTVAYMSPEQTRGEPLDRRTDLWSLGVVLYEMLAGARPFCGRSDDGLLQAILHEEPEPVAKRRPETPAWLARVVERLLRKETAERYGSAEELLADLTTIVSSGAQGSTSAAEARRPTRWIALGATAVLATVVLLFGIRTLRDSEGLMSGAAATGAAPTIAVIPFDVHGQGLGIWREGMVDLLSAGLDGAAGLHAINSRTVLARWQEEIGDGTPADLALALRVARRVRARYALVGSAVQAGPQLRLVADVYDSASGHSLGQAQVEGAPDSLLALVDRLGMKVLEVVFEEDSDNLPAIHLAAVTTSSLPALKAHLEGEARFRRADFEGAVKAWERALAADSLFALAYARLAEAQDWDEAANPDLAVEHLGMAHRLVDRLPMHEATIVEAKWAFWQGRLEGIPLLDEAVRERPDDAETWYVLGDAIYHSVGAMRGLEEAERAFRRAAELQPASAPYRAHLLDMAFQRYADRTSIARELEAYGRLAPRSARTRAGRVAFALAFGNRDEKAWAQSVLDTLSVETATQVYLFLRHPTFAAEREAMYLAIVPRVNDEHGVNIRRAHFYDIGMGDGRVRKALTLLNEPGTPASHRFCGPLRLSVRGMKVPEGILEASLATTRADSTSRDDPIWVICAATYAARRGRWSEHAALLSHARSMARGELSAGDTASAREWDRVIRETQAHWLWGRGRKAEALRAFEDLLSIHGGANWVIWYVGELSFELGRLEMAERAFRRIAGVSVFRSTEPLAYLYLGRIYERTGRTADAIRAYNSFAFAWREADPELRPLVQEARQAATRLSLAAD